jgi:hypothetical protein
MQGETNNKLRETNDERTGNRELDPAHQQFEAVSAILMPMLQRQKSH